MTIVPWLFGVFAKRRLGGMLNGDCYGAAIVVSEVGLLLVYPALVLLDNFRRVDQAWTGAIQVRATVDRMHASLAHRA